MRQPLTGGLVVVHETPLAKMPHRQELEEPDGRGIRHAQVPRRIDQQVRLHRHGADAPGLLGLLQQSPIVRSGRHQHGVALPDVVVLVGIRGLAVLHLPAQLVREPRVVPPADFPHQAVGGRGFDHEALPHGAVHPRRVERHPDLRALGAHGGDEQVKAALGDRLRLLDPAMCQGLKGFDALRRHAQAGENEQRAVPAPDLRIRGRVETAQAQPLYLVIQQALDRIPDGVLHLAGTQHTHGPLHTGQQQRPGEGPGLPATAAAVENLVAMRLEQSPEGRGHGGINGHRLPLRSVPRRAPRTAPRSPRPSDHRPGPRLPPLSCP